MSQMSKSNIGGGDTGTVTEFTFTDANGFSGIVTNSTTTPNLTLTTSVSSGEVIYSSSSALAGDVDFTYDDSTTTLSVGNSTTSSNGNIDVGGSSTGIGNINGGGGQLNIIAGELTLESNPGDFVRILTNNTERIRIEDDGSWLLASLSGSAGNVLTSNGAGISPSWQDKGVILVDTQVASNSASLDFINIGNYKDYVLVIDNITTSVAGSALNLLVSTDNGATFLVTGYNSVSQSLNINFNTVSACSIIQPVAGAIPITIYSQISIINVNVAVKSLVNGQGPYDINSTSTFRVGMTSSITPAVIINAFRLINPSGNLISGSASLYGVK